MIDGSVDGDNEQEGWRLLPYNVGPSLEHFAYSDALARLVSEPTIWWHSTDRPTLILGGGQRVDATLRATCDSLGVHLVQRQAGGTSVYASTGVLGLDIALPAGHRLVPLDVVEGYRWLGDVWNSTLHELGIDSHVVSIDEARAAPPPDDKVELALRAACFGTVSPYEVLVNGRKLVGLAQVRRRAGALLQAGIHSHFDAATLAEILCPGASGPLASALHRVATGLDEWGADVPGLPHVIETFQRNLRNAESVNLRSGEWTREEIDHARVYLEQSSDLDLSHGHAI